VSLSIPKFANEDAAHDANFGIGILVSAALSAVDSWTTFFLRNDEDKKSGKDRREE